MIKDFANLAGFTLREFAPSDLETYVELGLPTCAFMHGRPDVSEPHLRRNFVDFLRQHAFETGSEIYVVETPEHRVIGQLWLHSITNRFNDLEELWIWDVTVHSDFQQRGIGRHLLAFAKKRAHERHSAELWLLVSSKNDTAIRLYESFGLGAAGLLMSMPISDKRSEIEEAIAIKYANLRPILVSDIKSLYRLWTASGLGFKPRGRDSEARLAKHLGGQRTGGWGIWEHGILVAAALTSNDGRKGYIERLAALPTHRRKGIARAIVEACTAQLMAEGVLVIGALIAKENIASRTLFESCGYTADNDYLYYSIRESSES